MLLINGRKPTIKQRKFIKAYLKYGDAKKSALEVYNCKEDSASTIGWNILRMIDYSWLLEAMGITDSLLSSKLLDGLEATKDGQNSQSNGKNHKRPITREATASRQRYHNISDDKPITNNVSPDYAVRHKYLETALKLKNRLLQQPILNNYEQPTFKIYGGGYTPSIRGQEAGGVSRNVIPSSPPNPSHRNSQKVQNLSLAPPKP